MSDLKLSTTILVSYVIIVNGLANIDQFQNNVLNFSPIFFILMASAIFVELLVTGTLIKQGMKISRYMFLFFWGVVYLCVWFFYWRVDNVLPMEVLIIQFLLVELAAGLAYDVGERVGQLDKTLDGLSSSAYPNRTRSFQSAEGLIKDEVARSRRYHHPLSVMVMNLEKGKGKDAIDHYEPLQQDIMERFVNAKIGQIISDLSRPTDIILRDQNGQFVILYPETDYRNLPILASRIGQAVNENIGKVIKWGAASFPDDALNFEDLLDAANAKLERLDDFIQDEASILRKS